jgi:hypothetical protein
MHDFEPKLRLDLICDDFLENIMFPYVGIENIMYILLLQCQTENGMTQMRLRRNQKLNNVHCTVLTARFK